MFACGVTVMAYVFMRLRRTSSQNVQRFHEQPFVTWYDAVTRRFGRRRTG